MSVIDIIGRWMGYPQTPAVAPRRRMRGFDAAQINRLTASWGTQNVSLNQDLITQLPTLRARSRNLSVNNDYARKFLQMCETNIVGPTGFDLQWKPMRDEKTVDDEDAANLARAFWDWARRGTCEMSRQLSFCDVARMWVRCAARDGEFLTRVVRNPRVNKYGYALQVLDVDRLAFNMNEELRGGNVIKMGVEVSPFGEPVAYHLHTKHPGENTYQTYREGTIERVPAADIIHRFLPERPEQTRGFPWMVSAMLRLQNIGGFEDAAIVAARVGAAQMMLFETPENSMEDMADGQEQDGTLTFEAEPGTARALPPGFKPHDWSPDFPSEMYGAFIKACLRGISSGLGVAYNGLANDLEGVNFSSMRGGVLEERDNWMVLQNWLIESTLTGVALDWLRMSLLNGAITTKNGKPLPFAKLDKFANHEWQGRRWSWVDPEKDISAAQQGVDLRVTSRTRVAAQQGVAFNDVVAELGAEEKAIKSAGLEVAPQPPAGAGKPPAKKPANGDEAG